MGIEVGILGPLTVVVDGVEIGLGRQLRRLLAVLAIQTGHVVSADLIADVLWPDDETARDAKAVRTYVARLRQSLGVNGAELIRTQAPGYRLELGPGDRLDAEVFSSVAAATSESNPVERLAELDHALSLWSGSALADFADEPWAAVEATRLEEMRLGALGARHRLALEAGLHASCIADLEQLVALHPLRDEFTGLLMLALHRSGRQVDALRTFQSHRDHMADAGLDASGELRLLDERIARDDPLLGLESEPERIRSYIRGERVGEGAFSTVWRARQPTVDRDVAIKQVRAELADRPEFIRAFEREARVVAALEHPRIVPLYDYWREVGAAFLVMRYLRGGTLADAIPRAGASLSVVATVARHVGEALTAAHAHEIIHRDVKPANIFLDDEGNAYLGDFGIAIDAMDDGDDAAVSLGSPAYASPEQRLNEPASPASDLFCFAVSLYEALTGELALDHDGHSQAPVPALRDVRPDLPDRLSDVLVRATAAEPASRFPSVAEFVNAFVDAIDGGRQQASTAATVAGAGVVGPNPYRGLAAFGEADADVFFGRRTLVDELVERLGDDSSRLLVVVGPSGSGKSSAVRAGLLPALRRGAADGSDRWFTATMVPGVSPFEELEVALSHVGAERHPRLGEMLRDDDRGIARSVKLTLPDDGSDLLLVIDQFEELYTLCADDDERRAFAAGLATAVSDPRARLRVVMTIRADFWDRPLRDPALAVLIESAAVHVTPMTAPELEAAIVEPARATGCGFEQGLVARISADVAGQPGALPLLQYTLTELFDQRRGAELTSDSYEAMGGVAGAIGQRAESAYASLADGEQRTARRIFGRLVTLGEGADDTRRRVLRLSLGGEASVNDVLDAFGSARLISFDRDDATREPTVEIAHEALLRHWPRLRSWLDDDRADLRLERHLEQATREWIEADQGDGELYRGARLESALEWARAHPNAARAEERQFLDASEQRQIAERERERARLRRLRGLLTAAAVALAIAIAAGLVAENQRRSAADERSQAETERNNAEQAQAEAETERNNAEQARAEAEIERSNAEQAQAEAEEARDDARFGELSAETGRLVASGEDPDLAMLLAAEVHHRRPSADSLGLLQRNLARTDGFIGYLVGEGGHSSNGLAFSGPQLAVRSATHVEVWDTAERSLTYRVEVGAGTDIVVAQRRAFTTGDGELIELDLDAGAVRRYAHDDGTDVTAVDVTPDGQTLIVGFGNGLIERWSGGDWADRSTIGDARDEITHLALSPDGAKLVSTSSNGCCDVWDVASATLVWGKTDPLPGVGRLFNARWIDDRRVALAVGELSIVDTEVDRADAEQMLGNRGPEFPLAVLGPDRLVHGDEIVAISTGSVVRQLDANDGPPVSAAVGDGVIAIATDRAVSLWATDGSQLLARAIPREGADNAFVDTTGDRVLALDVPDGFTMRDLDTGQLLQPDFGFSPGDSAMASWMPSGDVMTYNWNSRLTQIWDPDTFEPIGVAFTDGWSSFTTSPNGKWAAFGGFGGDIVIYEVDSRDSVATLPALHLVVPGEAIPSATVELRFSWDSSQLFAIAGGDGVGVWETSTWEFERFLVSDDGEPGFKTVGVSRDGALLAVGDGGGRVNLFDTATWEVVDVLEGGPSDASPFIGTHGLRFTEDDRYLVMTGQSGAQLFQVTCSPTVDAGCVGRGRVGGPWAGERLLHVNPSPTGRSFVTATPDHLLVWDVVPDEWPEQACAAAGRRLTEEEWQTYFGTEPYDPAC